MRLFYKTNKDSEWADAGECVALVVKNGNNQRVIEFGTIEESFTAALDDADRELLRELKIDGN